MVLTLESYLLIRERHCPICGSELGEMEVKQGSGLYSVHICEDCGWLDKRRLK